MDFAAIFSVFMPFLGWFELTFRPSLNVIYFFSQGIFTFVFWTTFLFTAGYLSLLLFTMIFKKKSVEKEFIASKAPFVSINLPIRNELIGLRCARKCLEFDYPKDRYEIIIGDDSNIPSVSKRLMEFANKHPMVKVIRREENIGFKPGNLNNMLQYSKGEILVIFDSDFVPKKDFLKRIVTPFIYDKEVSAVQAKWNFNNFDQNLVTILASTMVFAFHDVPLSFLTIFGLGSLCGSAEAVKKKDLVALGGWLSGSLCEDIEYSLRLQKANKKMVYLPNLECYSEVPFTPIDFFKQQMRWAYGVINAYMIHAPSLMFNNKVKPLRRMLSFVVAFGYLIPILLTVMFISGWISFFSHPVAPFDLGLFVWGFVSSTLLTSGVIFASILVLHIEKKLKYAPQMIISSFTVGLVMTYFVNRGIFSAVLGKPMPWFLLNKKTTSKVKE